MANAHVNGNDYTTIQAAVDAANSGDTITVDAGTFIEAVNVTKSLTIQGANFGLAGDDVGRGAEAILFGGFHITADNVTIDGFEIQDGRVDYGFQRSGVFIEGAHANITVENSIVHYTTPHAEGSQAGVITTYGADTSNLQILSNLFEDFDQGMYLQPGVHDSTIDNNVFTDTGNPIIVDDPDDLTITNNEFGTAGGSKIAVGAIDATVDLEAELGLSGNTFSPDTTRLSVYPYGGDGQVILGTSGDDKFRGDFALPADSDQTYDGRAGNDTLIGGNGTDAMTGSDGNDSLVGGDGTGTDTAVYADTLSAGDFSYAAGVWTVTTGVGEGTDMLTGIEKVTDGGGNTFLLVDPLGSYISIQDAIDAASAGDTILIAPGTYTESAVPTEAGATPGGLYIDKTLTLQGYSSLDGSMITDASIAKLYGPTVIAGDQTDFSSKHLVGRAADDTVIQGLHLQSGDGLYGGKLLEIWADNVTVENNFIDVNAPTTGYSYDVAIYFNDNGTLASDEITQYTIAHNILNEGVIVANGVGDPSLGIGADQQITNNFFEGTFDYDTGLGRFDTVVINGAVNGVGWLLEPSQTPAIIGNIFENNTTPFMLRGSDNDAANLPTAAQVQDILDANGSSNLTYAYVVNGGDLVTATRDDGSGPYHSFAVTNAIDTLNLSLDSTPDAVFGGARDYIHDGDTIIVQSAGGAVNSEIMVDDATVKATANSADLNLTLATQYADSSAIPAGGVHDVTLADYAAGAGADVDVTGNDLGNNIAGNSGDNSLSGDDGDDSLTGGGGDDSLGGGADTDTADYATSLSAGDFSYSAGVWTVDATAGSEGTDSLTGIEKVTDGSSTFLLVDPLGSYTTIQAAIDDADPGDTILIGAGTYNENVVVNKDGLTLIGAGDSTIIQGTFKSDNSLAPGGSVADFLKTAPSYSSAAGIGVTVAADNVTLQDLKVTSFNTAVELGDGIDHTLIQDVTLDGSVNGMRKGTAADVTDLTILGGTFSDDYLGINFAKTGTHGDGLVDGMTIDGTAFEHLTQKGIYTETLLHGLITGITMNDVGHYGGGPAFGANGMHGNGIDINLKYELGVYTDITIEDFTFTDVGLSNGLGSSHGNAAAISVKARDDAPSYNSNPADFTGSILIQNGTIDGTSTGIRAGEAGKYIADPNVTVSNVAITNAVHSALHGDIANVTQSTMTVTGTADGDSLIASPTTIGVLDIDGAGGNDVITGGSVNDTLEGSGGNDTLTGEDGNDSLTGGDGDDEIHGGAGTDMAVYATSLSASDFSYAAGVWTVDATAGSEGTDSLTGIEKVTDGSHTFLLVDLLGSYTTIQAAINAANPGDTILVGAGTYNENVTVSTADLTIVGAGDGTDDSTNTIVHSTSGRVVQLNGGADNFSMSAVRVTGGGSNYGFELEDGLSGVTLDDVTVADTNVGVKKPSSANISDLTITNSEFADNNYGLYFAVDGSSGVTADEVHLTGVTFNDNLHAAVYAETLQHASFTDIQAIGNGTGTANGVVFDLWTGYAGTSFAHIAFDDVTIDNSGGPAVYSAGFRVDAFEDAASAPTDISFTDVSVDNALRGFRTNAADSDLTFTNVTLTDVTNPLRFEGRDGADDFDASALPAIGSGDYILIGDFYNHFYGGGYPYGANDSLTGGAGNDQIFGDLGDDVLKGGGGNDSLDGGAGTDTASYDEQVSHYTVGYTTDIHGFVTGFTSVEETTIVGTDEGTDSLNGIEKLQFSDTTLELGHSVELFHNSILVGTYDTIQDAVTAASGGDTILIGVGTFDGAVIDKELTIIGSGAGNTILTNAATNGFDLTGDINATSGGSATITIEGISFIGNQVGVRVSSSTVLDTLIIQDSAFETNKTNGVGMGSGAPNLGEVQIIGSSFVRNGDGTFNGDGDISLFGFTGDALIQDVTIEGGTNAIPTNANADTAIQINGRDPVTYDVTDPIGDVVFDNVSVIGSYAKVMVYIQGYTDLDGLSFASSGTTINGHAGWGYALYLDPTAGEDPGATPGVPGQPGFFDSAAAAALAPDVVDLTNVSVSNDIAINVPGGHPLAPFNGLAVGALVVGTPVADQVTGADGFDLMIGGDGNDLLNGADGDDILVGVAGDDTLDGGDGADTLDGGDGDDSLEGDSGTGNDSLTGGIGDDTLDGGAGADSMSAGADDDTYVVDDAGDMVTENPNEGVDTVLSSIDYTLGSSLENLTLTGSDPLTGSGNGNNNVITGNSGTNQLSGQDGNDTLTGGGGADSLDGGNGTDTADYSSSSAGVIVDLMVAGAQSGGDALGDTLTNIENVTGSATAANTLSGDGDANVLTGGSGNDSLDGRGGADVMAGGAGDDTYSVDDGSDVVTEANGAGTDLVNSSVSYTIALYVENLTLTGVANINGTGNTLDNYITGNTGTNVLVGGGGNDTLDGGAGADSLIGSTGNDTYVIDNALDQISDTGGTDTVKTTLTIYTLASGLENLTFVGVGAFKGTGNTVANILTGGSGNDTLSGGTGADTMMGGLGNDSYTVDNVSDQVTENPGQGIDLVTSSVTYTLSAEVENLTLSGALGLTGTGNTLNNVITGNTGANHLNGLDGNDSLNGGTGADTLDGGNGNDTLSGGTGADSVIGGDGNDTFVVDNAGDQATETSGGVGSGVDLVQSSITYTLGSNIENLTLTGSSPISGTGNTLDNAITGNSGANTLTGSDGNDTLSGGAGADSLVGGIGDDTYIVDNLNDLISEGLGEGIDRVQASVNYTLAANVDNLTLTGSALVGTGNGLANLITGNSGANVLVGGAGDDTLDGGAGVDTANYSSSLAGVTVDLNLVTAQSGGDAAGDILSNIENLAGSATAANALTGNAAANQLTGGSGNDTLDGRAGNDAMNGAGGDDTYIVDSSYDSITDASGIDTVRTTLLTYTLGAVLENLTFIGLAGNFTGNGNGLNNTIVGGSGNDLLDGKAGADDLTGGGGNDTYVADNAGDAVHESGGGGTDLVRTTLGSYTLGADVENLTFTGAGGFTGTGNGGANTITGGTGSDTLDGASGADSMIGGAGNDTYLVDNAGDRVNDSSGVDTVITTLTTYTLGGGVENLTYSGVSPFMGTGNTLLNHLTGGSANDTLSGGTGADTLEGGDGNDTYVVDNAGDQLIEASGGASGTDLARSSVSFSLQTNGANVESLTLTGAAAINGTGNADANTMTGNTNANILSGGGGNDTISAGAGNDTVDGGAGTDFLVGGTGNDHFSFVKTEANGDSVADFEGAGATLADVLDFHGYGLASTLTQVGATDFYTITDSNDLSTETIQIVGVLTLNTGPGSNDYHFL